MKSLKRETLEAQLKRMIRKRNELLNEIAASKKAADVSEKKADAAAFAAAIKLFKAEIGILRAIEARVNDRRLGGRH